jgi:hypothetical protein
MHQGKSVGPRPRRPPRQTRGPVLSVLVLGLALPCARLAAQLPKAADIAGEPDAAYLLGQCSPAIGAVGKNAGKDEWVVVMDSVEGDVTKPIRLSFARVFCPTDWSPQAADATVLYEAGAKGRLKTFLLAAKVSPGSYSITKVVYHGITGGGGGQWHWNVEYPLGCKLEVRAGEVHYIGSFVLRIGQTVDRGGTKLSLQRGLYHTETRELLRLGLDNQAALTEALDMAEEGLGAALTARGIKGPLLANVNPESTQPSEGPQAGSAATSP